MSKDEVHFDKAQYEHIIKVIGGVDRAMTDRFLKAGSTMSLDGTLGNQVKIGYSNWTPVADFNSAANEFGTSVEEQILAFTKKWNSFMKALKRASDVFEETDDLASYSASDFLDEYPEVAGENSFGSGSGGLDDLPINGGSGSGGGKDGDNTETKD